MTLTRVSQTPMITAGAYDVGDAVGGKLTFASVLADGASHGVLRGCRIIDKGRQSVPLELWLFREDFTHSNDNAVFNPSDSDVSNLAAIIQVGDWFHTAGNSVGQPDNLPQTFTLDSGDTTLYGQLVARGAPTYASTSDLVVELIVEHGAAAVARRSRRYFAPKPYPPLSTVTIAPAENYHTIHLKIEFDPPANLPASTPHVTGSYLRKGRWVKFHPAMLDAKGDDILYTVLFGLDEDTTYPIKLEFTRTIDATGALIERQTFHRVYRTRVTPASGSGGTRYMSPTGNDSWTGVNTTNSPAGTGPKKTPAGLAAVIPSGGVGVLLNDTYDLTNYGSGSDLFGAANWTVTSLIGAASAYKTIRAETAGQVTITGKKLLSGLSWTKHANFIYYADFSAFIDTTSNPKRGPLFMRNELSLNALYHYPGLTAHGAITAISVTANTSYQMTSAGHNLLAGNFISIGAIAGGGVLPGHLNRNDLQVSSVSGNTFTINHSAAGGSYSSGGGWFSGDDPPMELENVPAIEGFVIDWDNSRVYVRKKNLSGSITSSSDNTGAVRFTMSAAHGMIAGDRFVVSGHNGVGGAYDTVHKVTLKVSETIVETDVATAGDGTGGTWTMDTPPASGEYSASYYSDAAIELVTCKWLILDGIKFDMFGKGIQRQDTGTASAGTNTTLADTDSQKAWGRNIWAQGTVEITSGTGAGQSRTVASNTNDVLTVATAWTTNPMSDSVYKVTARYKTMSDPGKYTMRFASCENLVVRHCAFTLANCGLYDEFNKFLTIEDCSFEQHDWWAQFIANPFDRAGWDRVKDDSSNETSDIALTQFGATQTVVRRCTFEGGYYAVNGGGSQGKDDSDIYENTFTHYLDQPIIAEGFNDNSGWANAAVWHNVLQGHLFSIDFSPFARGPYWFVANDCRSYLFANIHKGFDFVSVPQITGGTGWTLFYHNRFWTDHTATHQNEAKYPHSWSSDAGQGNSVHVNNIFRGTGYKYIADDGSGSDHRTTIPGSTVAISFIKNAFYSASGSTKKWEWKDVEYTTESGALSAAAGKLAMIDNIYAVEPFPSGPTGALNSQLQDIAIPIDGITEIAGDSGGNLIPAPLDLGYFPKWANT